MRKQPQDRIIERRCNIAPGLANEAAEARLTGDHPGEGLVQRQRQTARSSDPQDEHDDRERRREEGNRKHFTGRPPRPETGRPRRAQIRSTLDTGSASRSAAMIPCKWARSWTSISRWKVWKLPSRCTS